ncbi:hypothetical protein TNCV_1767021 [Trichonephila clavipes]|nr:hypothetical protein TNCV_1767021 [Trichonephila clavipes]
MSVVGCEFDIPDVEGQMKIKSVDGQSPHVGMKWKFEDRVPAHTRVVFIIEDSFSTTRSVANSEETNLPSPTGEMRKNCSLKPKCGWLFPEWRFVALNQRYSTCGPPSLFKWPGHGPLF